ncbi:MAG: hypothetical protein DMG98_26985, partial [Acidobacteria bacterium]
ATFARSERNRQKRSSTREPRHYGHEKRGNTQAAFGVPGGHALPDVTFPVYQSLVGNAEISWNRAARLCRVAGAAYGIIGGNFGWWRLNWLLAFGLERLV